MVHFVTQLKATTKPAKPLRQIAYRGCCARVAQKLRVSLSVVCRVAKGKATSDRIAKALEREELRIEREIARDTERAA